MRRLSRSLSAASIRSFSVSTIGRWVSASFTANSRIRVHDAPRRARCASIKRVTVNVKPPPAASDSPVNPIEPANAVDNAAAKPGRNTGEPF